MTSFQGFVLHTVFGEEISAGNLDYLDTHIIEEKSTHGGKAAEIKTLMQCNRLHKILSARACEYLFLLKNLFSLIKNDLIALAFPKKNPFSEIDS